MDKTTHYVACACAIMSTLALWAMTFAIIAAAWSIIGTQETGRRNSDEVKAAAVDAIRQWPRGR